MNDNTTTIHEAYQYKGKEYPLFAFDIKPSITLQNGTTHFFKMWNEETEKKREDYLKTIVTVSPAVINGENPRDVKTDFTRSQLAYYKMMIEKISGVGFTQDGDPSRIYDAFEVVPDSYLEGHTDEKPMLARIIDLISSPMKKAAIARLYSGRIEVERNEDEQEDEEIDYDPFEIDITKEVEKVEKRQPLYVLNLERNVIIRQELGVEQLKSGVITEPTHVIRYHFREPDGDEFSKWELKGYRGYAISLSKGGEKSERYYNLDTVKRLFDSLIERIEGAALSGDHINLPTDRRDDRRKAILAQVPLSIKKTMIATLFSELNSGNF